MAEDGVAGLTMASLARAMDIRPPSLYKYYPSLLAVYDALFRRGAGPLAGSAAAGTLGRRGMRAAGGRGVPGLRCGGSARGGRRGLPGGVARPGRGAGRCGHAGVAG
jgi:AcrR family transcriptional regulator